MAGVARKDGVDSIDTGHTCDTTSATEKGSSTVFADGTGVCRKGDTIKIHSIEVGGYCVPHIGADITGGSSSVFADGIAIARKGDAADFGSITSGSSSVFAG